MIKLFERIGAWIAVTFYCWIAANPAKTARHEEPNPEPEQPHASPWHALPGGVIELGTTGFLIRHRPGLMMANSEFALESPEGRLMFTAGPGFLGPLKQAAERCAAERAEFVLHVATGGTGDAMASLLARVRSQH